MILQALVKLYDDLEKRGEISRPGWGRTRVGYALCLDAEGIPTQVVPLTEEVQRGKKTITVNQIAELPAPVKRSSGILPNFLWDHSGYIFGVDAKGDSQKSKERFAACRELHLKILADVDHPVATAISKYFERWDPDQINNCEAVTSAGADLLNGANIVFRVDGIPAQEVRAIADAWQRHYDGSDGKVVRCLVTGEREVVELTHPSVKGVKDAQSSGAALVSFNADAFCSYNREQGLNAPVGKRAAFAYTTALNHLLSDRENVHLIGDTTVVCWADGAEPQYTTLSSAALFGDDLKTVGAEELRAIVGKLAQGKPAEEIAADPDKEFYILGLAPNAARLSVRFFLRSSFGQLMANVNAHHERCEIVGGKWDVIPLWKLLSETVNQNSKDKSPSSVMAGSVARAIFNGTRYPASLLQGVMMRIRAEREITHGRAAIIKAYYLKNTDIHCPKEVLTVSLNENSTNVPYTLGRLFAIYEAVQEAANPNISTTIKDKYFNSAATTPAHIVPVLDSLCQKHLRKLDAGKRVWFEKKIQELKCLMGESNPVRLTLPEQGSFYLGYYHQKQKRFEKKENN